MHVFCVDYIFSFNYIVYKIQLVEKRYGINLQHYFTSSFFSYKNTQFLPLLSFSYFVQVKINKFHFKDFSKIYTSIKNFKQKYQVIGPKMHLNLHHF